MAHHPDRGDEKDGTTDGTDTLPDGTAIVPGDGTEPSAGASQGDEPEAPEPGRRSFLKFAGTAATAASLTVAGATDLADAAIDVTQKDDYEVWTVTQPEVYDLSDGETLSNVLVDQTDPDAVLTIRSRNKTGWEVRNVGFVGSGKAADGANRFQFQVSAASDGAGHIENVWANGKARGDQDSTELGGIFLRASHAGHIDIRNTYIEGFGNNAVYASGVGKDTGNDGSVHLENCYHRDNTSTQYRIGSPDSVVRNSVAVVNDPDGDRGTYPGTSNRNARGSWGKHFRGQRFKNCAFHVDTDDVSPDGAFEARYITDRSHGEEAVAEVVDCDLNPDAPTVSGSTSNASVSFTDLGESPSVGVIGDGGVPTSPKMAARGDREMPPRLPGEDSTDGGSSDLDRTLEIDGSDADRTDYSFTVSDDIENDPDNGTFDDDDDISGTTASGFVNGGTDGYLFSGEITDATVDGGADILVDGEVVDPATLDDTSLDRTLAVDGSDAGWTEYSFTVSEEIENDPDVGTFDDDDAIDGTTASGFVNGGVDGYLFAGEITDAAVDGDADVLVDGSVVDPATLGDADPAVATGSASGVDDDAATLNGTLENLGDAADAAVGFEYREADASDWTATATETLSSTGSFSRTVSGLTPDTDHEFRAVVEASDGDTATGGTATFTTETQLAHTIAIDGSDAGWTEYEFSVSGDVENDPDVGTFDDDDAIDGSVASGFVNGGTDGYRFSGEIVGITVDGDADVVVDGQVVDPASLVLPNTVVFDGVGDAATYDLAVSGELVNDPLLGATEGDDLVEGSTAAGTVTDDQDGFRFSGDLVSLQLDGGAGVTFEDNDG